MNSTENIEVEVETAVEPQVETEQEIDDMSEQEFEDFYNGSDAESTPAETEPEKNDEIDLDSLYKAQMDDTDGKLAKPMLIKVDGKVMEVSNINDVKNMMEKASGAKAAFQKIAGDVKTIDFLKDNNISQDDLDNLLSGRGQAPRVKTQEDVNSDRTANIIQNIESSAFADNFLADVSALPQDVALSIGSNPELLNELAFEYQEGYAQKVMPHVHREMTVKGISFEDAYQSVGKRLMAKEENTDTSKKVLGAMPNNRGNRSNGSMTAKDMDNMSDADFDAYYANL